MKIDSHHHFWTYDPEQYAWIGDGMEVLKRDFAPSDLEALTSSTGIEGVVSVQAQQTVEETDRLLDHARSNEFIKGVVGWVPLLTDEIESTLERYSDESLLKAVRHVVQDEPDDEFQLREDFNRGISCLGKHGLVYDILVYARQLPASISFADRHPEQSFVLDHIAKPTIQSDQYDSEWEKNFRELARRERITCKFSGVVTEVRDAEWSIETIRPYWDVALDAFGPDRLMFGSDWPVCLLMTGYERWVETVTELIAELSEIEQARIMGGTAIEAYSL